MKLTFNELFLFTAADRVIHRRRHSIINSGSYSFYLIPVDPPLEVHITSMYNSVYFGQSTIHCYWLT